MDWDWTQIDSAHQFSLYNLDGSLYKTILIPAKPDSLAESTGIWFISEQLFDNDPTSIEYIIDYYWLTSPAIRHHVIRVIREDGTILLDETDGTLDNIFGTDFSLFNTEEGAKLRIEYYNSQNDWYQNKVFNLPGIIPSSVLVPSLYNDKNMALFPNPNKGSFFIRLNSEDQNQSKIELFNIEGKLIHTYVSDNQIIHINEPGLKDGIYLLKSHTTSGTNRP